MSYYFTAKEILQFAIKIEENGIAFYRYAAQLTNDQAVRELFVSLADEELAHKRAFEDLQSRVGKYTPIESYPGEYRAYLRAYVKEVIFTDETMDNEIAGVKDPMSAIDFGIQRELESIAFYHEVKQYVPGGQHDIIDTILNEERGHFAKLSNIKREMHN